MNISSHVPLIYAIFSHKEGSMGSNLFETFHSSPFKTPAKKQPLLFEEEQPLKKMQKLMVYEWTGQHAKTHGLWMDWTPLPLKKTGTPTLFLFSRKTTDLRWCMHHLGQIYLPIFRFKFESLQNIHKLSDELSLPRCQKDLHELYLGNLDCYCWKNPWNTCIWHPAMC